MTNSQQTNSKIPASHRDLAGCPPVAALSTVTPDGYPQTSVVWCDFDGECVRINTMRGFAKERNMRRNPRVTLLCYDPQRPLRYLEVRGMVVDMTQAGAAAHLDALASKYAGRPVRFFGDVIPASFAETEAPVLCRIRPARVTALDATRLARRDSETWKHTTGLMTVLAAVPASHRDLLTGPACGVFTTLGHEGQPRSTLVRAEADDSRVPANTALGRPGSRDPHGTQKVSLLVVDPRNTSRFIQIRGDAELVAPAPFEHRETGVACLIHPRRVTLDAVHIADH